MIIVGELPQGGKVGPGTSTTMKKVLGNLLLKLHNIKNWGPPGKTSVMKDIFVGINI